MASLARKGLVICIRCRQSAEICGCVVSGPPTVAEPPGRMQRLRDLLRLPLWFAGAALAGSLLGAALAALGS